MHIARSEKLGIEDIAGSLPHGIYTLVSGNISRKIRL